MSCGLGIELVKVNTEVTKMLHICQGNCFCESSGNNFAKAKVLYCYGEVSEQFLDIFISTFLHSNVMSLKCDGYNRYNTVLILS